MKKLVSLFILISACIFMGTTAYAASSFSIGEVSVDEYGYIEIPVSFNSTDYSGINVYDLQVLYDNEKIDDSVYSSDDDFVDSVYITNNRGNKTYYGTSKSNIATDPETNETFFFVTWMVSTTGTDGIGNISLTDGTVSLFTLYLKAADDYADYSFTSRDFELRVSAVGYVKEANGTVNKIPVDNFATYITYELPEVDENWEYGYIKAMSVTITDASDPSIVYAEDYPLSYVIDNEDGTYKFVVKLRDTTNCSKDVVNISFNATITDDPEGESDNEEIITISESDFKNIEVEYLIDAIEIN
ncbi:MAG: hypothetical protein LIO87_10830 [Eubacterium sp.]|nr:hypothetical protein [Eubacterium sp.]